MEERGKEGWMEKEGGKNGGMKGRCLHALEIFSYECHSLPELGLSLPRA